MPKQAQIPYQPRKWQAYFHAKKKRYSCLVLHRRAGKTVGVVADLIDEAIKFDKLDPLTGKPLRNPQYAYVAPTRGQAEAIAWEYFKEMLAEYPGAQFHSTKLRITLPHPRGTLKIFLLGVENFDNIRGMYLDGYVLDEYGDMHPEARDKVLLPMISDRLGWEIILGTPKGDNQFKKRFDEALVDPNQFALILNAEDTGIIDENELANLKENMSKEAFDQEYMCAFDAEPEGYYYAQYMRDAEAEGRVGDYPYNPIKPVITFWDLGMSDTNVIWFLQEIKGRPTIIDYYENSNKGLEFYRDILVQKGYTYSRHFLPHDVMVRELTGNGGTRKDYLENIGVFPVEVVPKSSNLLEDINSTRVFLRSCCFDVTQTSEGIYALKNYSKKWDRREKTYLKTPNHNWASHAADGLRQVAVSWYSGIGKSLEEQYSDLPDSSDDDYNVMDF